MSQSDWRTSKRANIRNRSKSYRLPCRVREIGEIFFHFLASPTPGLVEEPRPIKLYTSLPLIPRQTTAPCSSWPGSTLRSVTATEPFLGLIKSTHHDHWSFTPSKRN